MVTKQSKKAPKKAPKKDIGVPWALRRTKQRTLRDLIGNFLRLTEENEALREDIDDLYGRIDHLEEQLEAIHNGLY